MSLESVKDVGPDDKDVGDAQTQVVEVLTAEGKAALHHQGTRRDLKPRHVQMIAISGGIGTGLFIGVGSSLAHAGPVGLLIGYFGYGLMVLSTFNALGEMTCYLPADGSFIHFANRFVDPSFSFALSVILVYSGSTVVAAEASAVAGLINYWGPNVNEAVWCLLAILVMTGLNVLGVKWYGEGEFYLSIFKVLLILGLSLFTFIAMLGGNPAHDRFGFRYWKDPGPFAEYIGTGGIGKFAGMWSVLLQAAYAFGGPEPLSNLAAESQAPRRVLPLMYKRVTYRLLSFYGLGALCAGILVPSDDPDLGLSLPGAGSSPFVLGAVRLGIPVLPSLINAALITSVLSCGTELAFSTSRALYAMALAGNAPKVLTRTWRGIPIWAVLCVNSVGCVSFLTASNASSTVFNWIVSLCGTAGLLNQALYHIIYIRWWKATRAQGMDRSKLPFARRGQIYISYCMVVGFLVILLFNGWAVFTKGNWSITNFLLSYLTIPIYLIALIGHRIYRKNWKWIPSDQVDLTTGIAEIEALPLKIYDEVEEGTFKSKVLKKVWG